MAKSPKGKDGNKNVGKIKIKLTGDNGDISKIREIANVEAILKAICSLPNRYVAGLDS